MGKLRFKISEKARSILVLDGFRDRFALLKGNYPDADPRILNNIARALFCDNLVIALCDNIITLEAANVLISIRMYNLALTDNSLIGFHEKLFIDLQLLIPHIIRK